MTSKYNVSGNIGAVGDNARAQNFTQTANFQMPDMRVLAVELEELKDELMKRARTVEELDAVQQITEAQNAAASGDENTVLSKLRLAGDWALKVATEIGKNVAVKVITNQIGLP